MVRILFVGVIVGLIALSVARSRAANHAVHPELAQDGVLKAAAALQPIAGTKAKTSKSSEELLRIADEAMRNLGDDHYAARMIRDAVDNIRSAENQSTTVAADLLTELKRVHESLTFRPLKEAELPNGFPPCTPLHTVEVKSYPAYRMARAKMKSERSRGNGAFWSLFKHIKRNEIAMTAPVQIDYSDKEADAKEQSMSFLYRTPQLGRTGEDAADKSVEVVETQKLTVASIGVRGKMTAAAVQSARTQLLDWLKQNADEYEVIGSMRRMGYNSPFVPATRQFYEVQIPIRLKSAKNAAVLRSDR